MHFAKTSAAVHFSWVTAHLYEEQIFIGVIAVTKACCELVFQSGTGQWEMHFAETSAAVHFSWVTAHLFEEQTSIGVNVVAKACCELVFQSSTEQ